MSCYSTEFMQLATEMFEAIDDVREIEDLRVSRLVLKVLSMMKHIETVALTLMTKKLDLLEEARRQHQAEFAAAQSAETRVRSAVDDAVNTFSLSVIKSSEYLKQAISEMVKKLEAREVMAQNLDNVVRAARERVTARMQEMQEEARAANPLSINEYD